MALPAIAFYLLAAVTLIAVRAGVPPEKIPSPFR